MDNPKTVIWGNIMTINFDDDNPEWRDSSWLTIRNFEAECNICKERQAFSLQDHSLAEFVKEHYAKHFVTDDREI